MAIMSSMPAEEVDIIISALQVQSRTCDDIQYSRKLHTMIRDWLIIRENLATNDFEILIPRKMPMLQGA